MSTPSTPKRIKKGSWATLVSTIPEEEYQGIRLKEILTELGDYNAFCEISTRSRECLLKSVLGDGSRLVDIILNAIDAQSGTALIDRLLSYDIAPSRIAPSSYCPIASIIFNTRFTYMKDVKDHLQRQLTKVQPRIALKSIFTEQVKVITDIASDNVFLHEDECDGYTILNILGSCILTELRLLYPFQHFNYKNQLDVANNQKPDSNPKSDGGIILAQSPDNAVFIPLMIFGYKCDVAYTLDTIISADLLELLLQAYYAIKYHSLKSLIASLTNLKVWHSFIFIYENEQVKIKNYVNCQISLNATEVSNLVSLFMDLTKCAMPLQELSQQIEAEPLELQLQ